MSELFCQNRIFEKILAAALFHEFGHYELTYESSDKNAIKFSSSYAKFHSWSLEFSKSAAHFVRRDGNPVCCFADLIRINNTIAIAQHANAEGINLC